MSYNNLAYKVQNISASTTSPTPYTTLIVDASGGEVNITFPEVFNGDVRWYRILLNSNSNHCNLTVSGGLQFIGDKTTQSVSSEGTSVLVIGNGVDGYYLFEDTRNYRRVIRLNTDTALTSGFSSNAFYGCHAAAGTQLTVTVPNWSIEHKGDFATFYKAEGVGSTIRVKSVDGTFDELINNNGEAFTILYGGEDYIVSQDSRAKISGSSINFYPTTATATSIAGYKLLVTNTSDTNYNDPAVTFSTPAITSLTGQTIGFYTTNIPVLSGLIAERGITAIAKIKRATTTLSGLKFKFKYYAYDIATLTLGTALLETSFSSVIDIETFQELSISGIIPEQNWDGKLLVIELIVARLASGGLNPVLDFEFGGATPSRTTIDVPATSITHDSLANVDLAATGVTKGHINDIAQTIKGRKTFTDSIDSPFNVPMKFNTNNAIIWDALGMAFGYLAGGMYFRAGLSYSAILQSNVERLRSDAAGVKLMNSYYMPLTDGTSGQIITTNGTGNLSFIDKNWTQINTSLYTATPASTSTITFTDTTGLTVGMGLKYMIGGVYYRGIITGLTGVLVTIAGIALSGNITELYYTNQSNVTVTTYEFDNQTFAAGVATNVESLYSNIPVTAQNGAIVLFKTWQRTADTGATPAKIKFMNGANHIFTGDADGINLSGNKTYNSSGVNLNSTYVNFAFGNDFRFDITQPGSNLDTTQAVIKIYQLTV